MPQSARAFLLKYTPPHVLEFALQFVRFGISGVTSSLAGVLILYVCTGIFGMWYVASSTIGFCGAFIVSFTLQKFWTFRESSLHRMPLQSLQSIIVAACNLALNTGLMFIFVQRFQIQYLLAQCIVYLSLGMLDYGIFKLIIFKHDKLLQAPSKDVSQTSGLA